MAAWLGMAGLVAAVAGYGYYRFAAPDRTEAGQTASLPRPPAPDAERPAGAAPPATYGSADRPPFLDPSVTEGQWRYYVIVGGAKQGSGWAAKRAAQTRRCLDFEPATDSTYAFQGLAPDIEFVHLGGYQTQDQARQILTWSKRCVPDAYIKRAMFSGD